MYRGMAQKTGGGAMTFAWWHVLVALAPMLPAFWSIWHIWNHSFRTMQTKMLWLAFVVFVPVLGGIVYIFAGRKQARPLDAL